MNIRGKRIHKIMKIIPIIVGITIIFLNPILDEIYPLSDEKMDKIKENINKSKVMKQDN